MAKSAVAAPALEIPVQYGDVSIGETTCRVGVVVARKDLTLAKADASVCGRRLVGRIVAVPGNGNPDQPQLVTDEVAVEAAFDVKRVGFNKKVLSFGLTFSIESVKVEDLAHFARRAGRLVVDSIENIPEGEQDDD